MTCMNMSFRAKNGPEQRLKGQFRVYGHARLGHDIRKAYSYLAGMMESIDSMIFMNLMRRKRSGPRWYARALVHHRVISMQVLCTGIPSSYLVDIQVQNAYKTFTNSNLKNTAGRKLRQKTPHLDAALLQHKYMDTLCTYLGAIMVVQSLMTFTNFSSNQQQYPEVLSLMIFVT